MNSKKRNLRRVDLICFLFGGASKKGIATVVGAFSHAHVREEG